MIEIVLMIVQFVAVGTPFTVLTVAVVTAVKTK